MRTKRSALRRARDQKGLSPADVASAAAISTQALWSLETGRTRPMLETAQRLANALGTTIDEIFPSEVPAEASR